MSALKEKLSKVLRFSAQSRRWLLLQAHKSIAIPTYIPKFTTTSGSSYLRVKDPDRERAEHTKLQRQLKEEKKRVVKELRKDAKFMSEVVQKKQDEEDRRYNERMRQVMGSFEGERAEEKGIERQKRKLARKS